MKDYIQKVLSTVRKAIDDYNLIQENDKIAVGISGGKDSLVLLKALAYYKRFSPNKFELVAITIDMFGNEKYTEIKKFCKDLNVDYYVVPSDIYEIVFNIRKEKNPCSLCSKLRRGILNTKAIELGCNKLALGHSSDDVIHTFLLSLFYEGRLNTFLPKAYMSKTNMTVIRPLVLTDERDIISASKFLPVKKSKCPVDKQTKREYVKELIKEIQKTIPFAKERIFGSIINPDRYNLFDKIEPNKKDK